MRKTHLLSFALAAAFTLPGVWLHWAGMSAAAPVTALASGVAILGASFLLLWACDAAQADISQALALAVVALIAVLPEYSVDMYFTWQAGKHPASSYAHYAIANMTGANRLLIGVAWAAIAGICWLRFRKPVVMEGERRTEIVFLGAATLYAFVFAGFVILYNAEPFCEGLVATGRLLHINEFLLVQWLAPIASEAPEFTVALVFAWRVQAGLALRSLLSAKLNQWTLLVGMIPGVFALSHGTLQHPMPMDGFQMAEILLTAAQSLLAVVLLAGMRLTGGGALLLFGLFAGQLVMPAVVGGHPLFGLTPQQIHPVFSFLYLVAAMALFAQNPRQITNLIRPREDDGTPRTPHCLTCKWRRAAQQEPARNQAAAAGR